MKAVDVGQVANVADRSSMGLRSTQIDENRVEQALAYNRGFSLGAGRVLKHPLQAEACSTGLSRLRGVANPALYKTPPSAIGNRAQDGILPH